MDQVLGLLFLAGYIVAIVGLAAAVTFTVIRIFPTERTPKKGEKAEKKPDKADKPDEPSTKNGEAGAGALFRRSKRRSG